MIHFPNSLNPDLSKIETNQKRQSEIMDLWAKMMETQTEILQKQEIENKGNNILIPPKTRNNT